MNNDHPPGCRRYRTLSGHLRERFGCRVQKVTLDGAFTCPTRDGTLGREGCLYCDEEGSGPGRAAAALSIEEQIRRGMDFARRRYGAEKFIAYFQAFTNTYAPLMELEALYKRALSFSDVVGLSVGTRPDCVQEETLGLLSDIAKESMVWLEVGLQSTHNETLRRTGRGHDYAAFLDAVERTKRRGLEIVVHVILGLPGERREEMIQTAKRLSSLPLDGIKIHALYVASGTRLEKLYEKGGLRLMAKREYILTVCDFLELLPPDTVIHRLTGEAKSGRLVAPVWLNEKQALLREIEHELAHRDSWQGKRWKEDYRSNALPACPCRSGTETAREPGLGPARGVME